jgi:hypothetical protein
MKVRVRWVGQSAFLLALVCIPASFGQSAGAGANDAGNCTLKDDSTRPDCPQALEFFLRFQSALRRDDRLALIGMVHFPLLTSVSKSLAHVRSKEQLLANYDLVFSPDVRCMVLAATVKDVWGNYQGFSITQGTIWFESIVPSGDTTDVNAHDYWTKFPIKLITVNNDPGFYRCPTAPHAK